MCPSHLSIHVWLLNFWKAMPTTRPEEGLSAGPPQPPLFSGASTCDVQPTECPWLQLHDQA